MPSDRLTIARELHPLRVYRQRNQLSLKQLAARAGLQESSLSRIESCECTPTLPVMLRLSVACQGEVSEFDLFRYHLAAATGLVVPLRAPMTSNYQWDWVTSRRERPRAAA